MLRLRLLKFLTCKTWGRGDRSTVDSVACVQSRFPILATARSSQLLASINRITCRLHGGKRPCDSTLVRTLVALSASHPRFLSVLEVLGQPLSLGVHTSPLDLFSPSSLCIWPSLPRLTLPGSRNRHFNTVVASKPSVDVGDELLFFL